MDVDVLPDRAGCGFAQFWQPPLLKVVSDPFFFEYSQWVEKPFYVPAADPHSRALISERDRPTPPEDASSSVAEYGYDRRGNTEVLLDSGDTRKTRRTSWGEQDGYSNVSNGIKELASFVR